MLVESCIVEDEGIAQRLAQALLKKRAEGVEVALMYDHLGSFGTDAAYFDALRAGGVAVCAFNPLVSLRDRRAQPASERDHRKIVAVDGTVGFTGGINISGVYASGSFSRQPRDTHVQVRGPAARQLDRLVRQTWRDQGCEGALGDEMIDGVWSTVGAINLDFRSFVGNNEINVVVHGAGFGGDMERMFAADRVLQGAARLFERWW